MKNRKQVYLKFGILSVIVLVFFIHTTYAADTSVCKENNQLMFSITNILIFISKIVSRVWIVLGNIAGTLMTNKLVYGEAIGLDIYLWKLWQISRNFCNYAIGVVFLYNIIKYVLFPSEEMKTIKTSIVNLLISSVLIQASWFLMMAVVDISTVALATVTSFPSQVVSASTEIKQDFQTLIGKNEILKYYSKDKMIVINAFSDDYLMGGNNKEFIEEVDRDGAAIDEKKMIDMLLPKGDNLGGPLMFLGFSAINASDYSAPNNFQANDCPDLFTKILTYIVLNSAVTTMYAIALLILIIILVSRLFYLWIFIAISPVIILLNFGKVFDAGKAKDLFGLKNVLRLIFQPVIFGMFISIMLLFVVVAKDFFNTKSYNYSLGSISIIDRTSDSEMKIGDMVKIQIKELGKPVGDLFVALMTVIFMRFLIKLAIGQSTKGTKIGNFVTGIAEKAEEVALNTGFVPTPKGNIGFKQLKSLPYEYLSKKTYPSLENNTRKANKLLNRALGLNTMIESMDTKQQQELLNVATYSKNRSDFSKKIRDIKAENGGIKFSEFMDYFGIWASNNQENTDMNNVIKGWTEIIAKQFANYNVKDTLENKRSKFKEAFSGPNQKNKEAFNDFYGKVLGGKNTNVQEYQDLFRNNNGNIPV